MRDHPFDLGDAAAQGGENRFQPIGVVVLQELDDVDQIVAAARQMLLRAGGGSFLLLPRREMREMPAGDERQQGMNVGIRFQLSERGNRQHVGTYQGLCIPAVSLWERFASADIALAFYVIEQTRWRA